MKIPPLSSWGWSWSVVVSMRSVLTLARSDQGRGYSEQFYTNPWYFWQNIRTPSSEECKVVQGHKTAIISFIKIHNCTSQIKYDALPLVCSSLEVYSFWRGSHSCSVFCIKLGVSQKWVVMVSSESCSNMKYPSDIKRSCSVEEKQTHDIGPILDRNLLIMSNVWEMEKS